MIQLLSILLLAAGLGAASAQELDPAAVQVLAGPCASCHGPEGRSPGAIPPIAGLPADTAVKRMLAFREDADPSATVMPRLMKGYDEDEIRALAQWFAGIGK